MPILLDWNSNLLISATLYYATTNSVFSIYIYTFLFVLIIELHSPNYFPIPTIAFLYRYSTAKVSPYSVDAQIIWISDYYLYGKCFPKANVMLKWFSLQNRFWCKMRRKYHFVSSHIYFQVFLKLENIIVSRVRVTLLTNMKEKSDQCSTITH